MKTIWKATLPLSPTQDISIPAGAKFLSVAGQGDALCAWFLCDSKAPQVNRQIRIVGTGHEVPHDGVYLGTALLMDGQLVLHLFETVMVSEERQKVN